jgi:hypothetical protein
MVAITRALRIWAFPNPSPSVVLGTSSWNHDRGRISLIEKMAAELPVPIDVYRDSRILERHGLTRERLMDRRGAGL